jgi:hypothetical protein
MGLSYNFHGVNVKVDLQPDQHSILEGFSYFQRDSCKDYDIEVDVHPMALEPERRSGMHISFRQFKIYGVNQRRVEVKSGLIYSLEKSENKTLVKVHYAPTSNLKELLYHLLNSLVGWELELRGWIRLHAAAVIKENAPVIFLAPSRGGKTTWAFQELASGAKIYSDEIVWISPEAQIHAWPIPLQFSLPNAKRLGISESDLVAFPKEEFQLKYQFILDPASIAAPSSFKGLESSTSAVTTWFAIVSGWGLPQGLDLHLRLECLPEIIKVAWQRAVFGLKIIFNGKCRRRI